MTLEAFSQSKNHNGWGAKLAVPLKMYRDTIDDHFSIYMITLFTLGLALIVANITNVSIDFSLITMFVSYLISATLFLALGIVTVKFCHLVLVEKPASPTKALLIHLANRFYDPVRIVSVIHMFIAFAVFSAAFSLLRSSVSVLNPFEWDVYFRDLDKILHFGSLPHEWLRPMGDNVYFLAFINFIYNCWYFLMIASVFTAGIITNQRQIRLQFLNAFFLTWLVLGFFLATGFSSAGPCFFDRLDLGTDYNSLMASLNNADKIIPIWALPIQDLLWEGYSGTRNGSVGITAFPSIHVATSVLMAIAGFKISQKWGILLTIYACLIMIGSVALGWHYAVDGYASAILIPIVWWVSGKLVLSPKA